jgi:hypothetical protein
MEDEVVTRCVITVICNKFVPSFVQQKQLVFCTNQRCLRPVVNCRTLAHLAAHIVYEREECHRVDEHEVTYKAMQKLSSCDIDISNRSKAKVLEATGSARGYYYFETGP